MSDPVFWAPEADLRGPSVVLEGAEAHHAVTVRRLRVGEHVDLTDGRGTVAHGAVTDTAGGRLAVQVHHTEVLPAPEPRVDVVQALPKGDRGEVAVETLTEVGVDVVVPWSAARCVAQWRGERGARSQRRWVSTAVAAAKQSRRRHWPEVRDLHGTPAVRTLVAEADCALVLHESADTPLSAVSLPSQGSVLLVVGPEGGLTDTELTELRAAGAQAVHLGPSVLRTSTAGTVAAAVVLAAVGRWESGLSPR